MRQIISIFFISILAISTQAAEFGICNYGKVTLPTLTCYGSASLRDTTVKGQVLVTGPLIASSLMAGSLKVTGPVTLTNSEISSNAVVEGAANLTNSSLGSASISGSLQLNQSKILGVLKLNGPLIATESMIMGTVIAVSNTIQLSSTTINGLVLVNSATEAPLIQLKTNSLIDNSVRFPQKAGVIELDNQSKVKGPILNGQVKNSTN